MTFEQNHQVWTITLRTRGQYVALRLKLHKHNVNFPPYLLKGVSFNIKHQVLSTILHCK